MADLAPADTLARVTHAVLATWSGAPGDRRLVVLSAPAWWDGERIWLTVNQDAEVVREQPACALVLTAADGTLLATARGTARLFGVHDPLGLALHAPAIAGALAALTLRGGGAPRPSWSGVTAGAPVVRVVLEAAATPRFPSAEGGPTPALPTEVTGEVRREVTGVREVLVLGAGALDAYAAVWSGGMALRGAGLPQGRVAVVVTAGATGLALEGDVESDGRFTPLTAQWWRDGLYGQSPVRAGAPVFVLPE